MSAKSHQSSTFFEVTSNAQLAFELELPLPPVPFLLGHTFSGSSIPRPVVILAGMPVAPFLALPRAGCKLYCLKWHFAVFCTFTGVNFLAGSTLESSNLRIE